MGERGLSQTQLAAKLGASNLGITQGYLSELEAGTKNPTLETILVIARALGVSTAVLLTSN